MNQMDIDMSLLDNYNKFNVNSSSKTIRDAIRERHNVKLESNFGGSDLSMAHMLDEGMSNATGTSFTTATTSPSLTTSINPLAPRVTSFSSPTTSVSPIIPKVLSPTSTTKTAILDTASTIKPADLNLPSSYMPTPNQSANQSVNQPVSQPTTVNPIVSSAPISMGGGGGGGGGISEENSGDNAKVAATEKKYLGLTKKQGLIALGVLAVGTFAYFKFYKKAF